MILPPAVCTICVDAAAADAEAPPVEAVDAATTEGGRTTMKPPPPPPPPPLMAVGDALLPAVEIS